MSVYHDNPLDGYIDWDGVGISLLMTKVWFNDEDGIIVASEKD